MKDDSVVMIAKSSEFAVTDILMVLFSTCNLDPAELEILTRFQSITSKFAIMDSAVSRHVAPVS